MRTKYRLQTEAVNQLRIGDQLICVDGGIEFELPDGAGCREVVEELTRWVRWHGVRGKCVGRTDSTVSVETPIGCVVTMPLSAVVFVVSKQ